MQIYLKRNINNIYICYILQERLVSYLDFSVELCNVEKEDLVRKDCFRVYLQELNVRF